MDGIVVLTLITHYSSLITHHSSLITQYSVLSTQYSVLSTQYSELSTQYSELGIKKWENLQDSWNTPERFPSFAYQRSASPTGRNSISTLLRKPCANKALVAWIVAFRFVIPVE